MNNNTPHSSIPKTEIMSHEGCLEVLRTHRGGAMVMEFNDKLKDAGHAALETGKSATVTIVLKITPDQKTETIRIGSKVTSKIPELPEKETLFFIDEDGNFTRNDFKQPRLFTSEDARLAG